MCSACFRKIVFMLLILVLLAATAGCETMGAMKAGDITMEDFIQMAQATLPRPRENPAVAGKQQDENGIDGWFKTNLW